MTGPTPCRAADRLVEELYAGKPPPTAAKSLQAHVSRLRKALGGDGRLQTRGRGYTLDLSGDELDIERFATLHERGKRSLDEGEPEPAAASLRQALALWRGVPLGDLAYDDFAQAELSRLEELRLTCLEDRLDADLALGRHAEVVGELEGHVAGHPLRERPRAQLMLALYRCGRQAEALEAYQDARRRLVDELGIEPGRTLRELHQAVLIARAARPQPTTGLAMREVRKTVTAVVAGLAIASAREEGLDPEALRHVIGRALVEVELAVKRHGGSIETVTGDGVTALFGLPAVHEDDALRGVRAAAEARDALLDLASALVAEGPLELDFGIGVSTGEVVTGAESAPQLRATGEPLTLSSRLGQAARPSGIMIDEATRRLVRDAIVAEPANEAWSVIRLAEAAAGHVSRLVSPMVGRDRERRRLHDAFDQAVSDRSCQLFTVLGVAGVGKSRLVQEFLGDVAGIALIARGRCLPYGEGITYWPLLEAVKEAVGLEDGDSLGEAQAKLVAALEG